MPEQNRILCRELSLLAFNRRVLAQAQDTKVPLLERLRFLCIVSSNLDAFFEVRMAWLKRENKLRPHQPLDNGKTAAETIEAVAKEAQALIREQYDLFNKVLQPALSRAGIHFYRRHKWTAAQKKWIENYFDRLEFAPVSGTVRPARSIPGACFANPPKRRAPTKKGRITPQKCLPIG